MNTDALQTLMSESRQCAMAMLDSGIYIQRELPSVRMDDAARASAADLCSQLIATKHDVMHELFELDGLLQSGDTGEPLTTAADRILRWLWEPIEQMQELVTTLRAAAQQDPACDSAYILVAESSVNILHPYIRAQAAADLLTPPDSTDSTA